jgi:hypothetical protein
MAIITTEQMLEKVQNAIVAILETGQTYSVEGRSLTRADLPTLYAKERQLLLDLERHSKGGGLNATQGIIA